MEKQELSRITAIKAALVQTTNTQGWSFIKQIAANVVKKAVQEALDEENREAGESKRLKAKALQKGFDELFAAIEMTKGFDLSESKDESGLGALEVDYAIN